MRGLAKDENPERRLHPRGSFIFIKSYCESVSGRFPWEADSGKKCKVQHVYPGVLGIFICGREGSEGGLAGEMEPGCRPKGKLGWTPRELWGQNGPLELSWGGPKGQVIMFHWNMGHPMKGMIWGWGGSLEQRQYLEKLAVECYLLTALLAAGTRIVLLNGDLGSHHSVYHRGQVDEDW